jgi:hypothetical protein
MKRILLLLTCVGTLMLGACTSDSALPNPTGKGAIRAINAIKGAPEVGFLIEERSLGGIRYKQSTTPAEYDDFSYNFNFEVAYPGENSLRRVATENLKIEPNGDHILLLTGDISAPTVIVWNGTIRSFDDTETVLEARFAHANAALGDIDVYFEAPGTAPGTNPPAATLSFGQIADAADFAAGSYVMTVTAANDLNTVYFTSQESTLLPRFAHVITIYEGDLNNTAPVLVRSMTSVGNPLTLVDANYPSQTRLVHGASTLPTVDIYDDELLTSLVYAGLDFKGTTPYFDAPSEGTVYYFTPASSTATILFEQSVLTQLPGSYTNVYAIGDTDAWSGVRFTPARAATSTSARIRFFHAALNHDRFDAYIVDRDVLITEDDVPILRNAAYGIPAPIINIQAGNVDVYLTVSGETTVLAGPFQFDATLGSSIELLVVDTVDPATAEIVDITIP